MHIALQAYPYFYIKPACVTDVSFDNRNQVKRYVLKGGYILSVVGVKWHDDGFVLDSYHL